MRVSTYSRQFHAEHDSINADQPVRANGLQMPFEMSSAFQQIHH